MTEYDKEEIVARYQRESYKDPLKDLKNQRVAVYIRTAVASSNQVLSVELLKKHYMDFIEEHEGWTLVRMYIDDSASVSHIKEVSNLQRMLSDARNGMFNLIITMNVSCFSRNIVDVFSIIRELSAHNPPIGVYFDEQKGYTLDETLKSEMLLALVSFAAEEENSWKAKHMTGEQHPQMRYDYRDAIKKKIWRLK